MSTIKADTLEKSLKDYKRIKLVLTGGGTRGVFQIGAVKALKELGLWDNVVSLSGCSIGTINAVALLQYDIEACYDLWLEISKREIFKGINQHALDYYYRLARASVAADGVDINPFISLFHDYFDEKIIRQSQKEIVITTYNMSKLKQEYVNLNKIEEGHLIDYIVASSRLPIFQPIFINGDKYIDGGLGDNQPYYTFLNDTHFDLVITIKIMQIPYYIPAIRQTNITFDKEVIISPTSSLGNPLGFKKPTFAKKYEMGYKNTLEILQPLV